MAATRTVRRAAGALGDKVGIILDFHCDLVEQLVDRDETWPTYVPMRLFHPGMQIDRSGQVLVEKLDGLRPNVLGQCVVCRLHGGLSPILTKPSAISGVAVPNLCAG